MFINKKIIILSKFILSYSKFVSKLSNILQNEILNEFHVKDYNMLSKEDKDEFNDILTEKLNESEKEIRKITTNPVYMSWIVKNISNGDFIMWEDSDKFKELLSDFDKFKRNPSLKNIEKDINKYKNYAELHEIITDVKKDNLYNETIKKIHPILSNGSYKVYKLTDYIQSKPLLKNTGWCVQQERFWNSYGQPYYLITKNNERYALVHFDSSQCKDIHDGIFEDDDVDDDFIKLLEELFVKENNNNIIFDGDFSDFSYSFFNDIKSNDDKVKFLYKMDCDEILTLLDKSDYITDINISNSNGEKFYEVNGGDFHINEDLFNAMYEAGYMYNLKGLSLSLIYSDSEKVYNILERLNNDEWNKLKNDDNIILDLNDLLDPIEYNHYLYKISDLLLDNNISVKFPEYYLYYLMEEYDFERFKKLIKILSESNELYEKYSDFEILNSAYGEIFDYLIQEGYYTLTINDLENDNIISKTENLKDDIVSNPSQFLGYLYYEDADELETMLDLLNLNEEQYEAIEPFVQSLRKKEIFEQTPDLPLEFEKEN